MPISHGGDTAMLISHRGRFDDGGAVMVRPLFGKVETLGPWTAHIQAMDQALQSNDPGESVRSWRQAYSAALSHPGWLGPLPLANPSPPPRVFPGPARGAAGPARATARTARF